MLSLKQQIEQIFDETRLGKLYSCLQEVDELQSEDKIVEWSANQPRKIVVNNKRRFDDQLFQISKHPKSKELSLFKFSIHNANLYHSTLSSSSTKEQWVKFWQFIMTKDFFDSNSQLLGLFTLLELSKMQEHCVTSEPPSPVVWSSSGCDICIKYYNKFVSLACGQSRQRFPRGLYDMEMTGTNEMFHPFLRKESPLQAWVAVYAKAKTIITQKKQQKVSKKKIRSQKYKNKGQTSRIIKQSQTSNKEECKKNKKKQRQVCIERHKAEQIFIGQEDKIQSFQIQLPSILQKDITNLLNQSNQSANNNEKQMIEITTSEKLNKLKTVSDKIFFKKSSSNPQCKSKSSKQIIEVQESDSDLDYSKKLSSYIVVDRSDRSQKRLKQQNFEQMLSQPESASPKVEVQEVFRQKATATSVKIALVTMQKNIFYLTSSIQQEILSFSSKDDSLYSALLRVLHWATDILCYFYETKHQKTYKNKSITFKSENLNNSSKELSNQESESLIDLNEISS